MSQPHHQGQPYGQHAQGYGTQQQPQYAPPAPPAPPKKKRTGLKVFGAIVAVLAIIGIANAGGGESGAPTGAATTTTASAPALAAPAPVVPAAPTTQAAPVEPAGPLTTFGNGTYEVGVDVAPGKYRSPGVQDSIAPLCYWDLTDEKGTIKDQGVANEGPSRATLRQGLTFKSSGCEDWTLQN